MATDADFARARLTTFFQAGSLLALGGASLGLAVACALAGRELGTFSQKNEIERSLRYLMLGCIVGGAILAPLVGMVWAWRRVPERPWDWLHGAARRLSPLYGVGCLPWLFRRQIWQERELDFLVLVALFSVGEWTAAKVAQAAPAFAWERRLRAWLHPVDNGFWARLPGVVRRHWATVLLLVGMAAVGWIAMTRLAPPAVAWADENTALSRLWHGALPFDPQLAGGTARPSHASFFAYVLALIHALLPYPATLLVSHTVLVVGAAWPLFLLARRQMGQGAALLVAWSYLLYPALHGVAGRSLGYLPLGLVFYWFAWDGLLARRDGQAAWATLLGLAIGEEVAIWLVVLGLYLLFTRTRPRAGLVVAALGACYFVVLAYVVLPRYGTTSYAAGYHGVLGSGQGGLGATLGGLLINPGYAVSRLVDTWKLTDALELFIPLAFLPLRSPLWLLWLIPGLLFTVLTSEHGALGDLANPLNAHWVALLFVGVVLTLGRYRRQTVPGNRPHIAALVALLAAMIPSSYHLGAVLRRPMTPITYAAEASNSADRTSAARTPPHRASSPPHH